MSNYFECKVKFEKVNETTGKLQKITETYLVDAMSFTEAEAKITDEIMRIVSGEFVIKSIRPANYAEVNLSEPGEGQFFKCKVAFVSIDDATGKSKRVTNTVLIQAANIDEAFSTCKELFSTLIVDHKAISVTETSIVDVF